MSDNGQTKRLAPDDVHRAYGKKKYENIEVLEDGTIRHITSNGDSVTESVTRSLKTEGT